MMSRPVHTAIAKADAPLRLPVSRTRVRDLRVEAARQLRMSLWLMGVIAVAFTATLLARPQASPTAALTEFSGLKTSGMQTATAAIEPATTLR
jgi:hypothetical protein